ncbi:type IV pilus assembly protein PilM [Salinibacterium sp.]|uniref:type IV pilus assembly protein PilM n=1 Tax=Salinibacterium sp. TaxID=1915057 RepID=UPI00286C3B02|nr:type IV pilus assembly protein PilM [Salinibacterium sp.]
MASIIVGVDIGATGIRGAEVEGTATARPILRRYHEVPLPRGAVSKGEVIEPALVATALKTLWSQGGFTSKKIVLGVGSSRVLARDISMPKAPIKMIREMLPLHVQEVLPFPAKDAVLDFYPISEGDDNTVNGLLVAVLESTVAKNISAARLSGLSPSNVDLIPFAITRVNFWGGEGSGTVALVDVGASTTTVVVATGGVPTFVRIIPTGGDEVTSALASRLSIDPDAAEQIKRSLGLSAATTPEERLASAAIFETTGQLITSIRETLNYFASAHPTTFVGSIILSGGASHLRGFGAALGEYSRLPVTAAQPFGSLNIRKPAEKSIASIGVDASPLVAVGLALGSAA